MGYSCSIENKGGYLHIRISGENTPENLRAYLRDIYEACSRTQVSDVLIEESLEGPPLEPIDVYTIISESSAQTSPVIGKIAYVDANPDHPLTNLRLGEKVARDRGVNVRAFSSFVGALEWLSEG